MRPMHIAGIMTLTLLTLVGFQNCGGKEFSGTAAESSESGVVPATSTSSNNSASTGNPSTGGGLPSKTPGTTTTTTGVPVTVTVTGSQVANSLGQTLNFMANDQTPIGNATASVNGNSTLTVNLYNASSGRKAQVIVQLDPKTGAFTGVYPTGLPFMCHDPNSPPCQQGYNNITSGGAEPNCNSAINFGGAFTGSVSNITTNAWMYYACH